ncbi:unnamed protein product, partial [Scytosiphon promiscuus]
MSSDHEQPREVGPGAIRRRTRQRTQPEEVHVRVPVAFNQHLKCGDAAFVLVELLRSVLFMRGQLPMPAHELLSVRHLGGVRRRGCDQTLPKLAILSDGQALLSRASTASTVSGGDGDDTRGCRTAAGGRKPGRRAKSKRPLAKAPAHRRARKLVAVLEEITLAVEEAFADASRNGRPVLEALILLGASHLSPREVYTVMFAEPSSDGSSGNGGGVQGRSGLAEAYARKLVRSMVGAMSSVNLRGLGPSRVHLFLRIADTPAPEAPNLATPAAITPHVRVSVLPTIPADPSPTSDMRFQEKLHAAPATSARSGAAVAHLSPLPGFKIRVSRSRPAPKV